MRLRLLVAAFVLALPVAGLALAIEAVVVVDGSSAVSGHPVVAALGDVENPTFQVPPLGVGIAGHSFTFDADPGIDIQTLDAALSGPASLAADRRGFSFNNTLAFGLLAQAAPPRPQKPQAAAPGTDS